MRFLINTNSEELTQHGLALKKKAVELRKFFSSVYNKENHDNQFGYWNLEFICDLELGIWYFNLF